MKTVLLLIVGTCLSSLAMGQTESGRLMGSNQAYEPMSEVTGSLVYFFPSQQYSGFYDRMFGAEIQYAYWLARPFGVSAVGGMMSADVRSKNSQLVDPNVGRFEDSAQMLPIGISALYTLGGNQDWRVDGEVGLRYVFVDSSIQVKSVDSGATEDVDLDNAVVALLRVNVNRRLSDDLALFMSAGVQNDLAAGDISTRDGKLGDNNFKGYSLSLGLTYAF